MHALLLVIFLFASAFSASKTMTLPPVITLVGATATDRLVATGGNPNGNPAPPAPAPQPKPVEVPKPQAAPVIPKPEPKPVKKEASKPKEHVLKKDLAKETLKDKGDLPVRTSRKQEKKQPDKKNPPKEVASAASRRVLPTNVVRRATAEAIAAQAAARADELRRAEAERQYRIAMANYARQKQEIAEQVGGIIGGVGKSLSHSTVVEPLGPGGEAFVNYGSWVREKYDRAWRVSQGLIDDDGSTLAKVTIRRDGTVQAAAISRRSGNPVLDKSVQRALDEVRFIAPFPEGAKEPERTFTIEFNLKTRKAVG